MTVGKTDEIKQELARKVENTKAGTKLKKSMSIADMIKYEEMAKEQISASGLRIPEAYNPSIIPRYRHIYMWMIYGVLPRL